MEKTIDLLYLEDTNSPEIIKLQNDILDELSMNIIALNLKSAITAIDTAYNKLNGTMFEWKLSQMQKNLLDMCDECLLILKNFRKESKIISETILCVYNYLLNGNYTKAKEKIIKCCESGKRISNASAEVAKRFRDLSFSVCNVIGQLQNEEALKYHDSQELDKEIEEYKIRLAAEENLRKQLDKDVKDACNMYLEQVKIDEEAEKDSFNIFQLLLPIPSLIYEAIKGSSHKLTNSKEIEDRLYNKIIDLKRQRSEVNNQLSQILTKIKVDTDKKSSTDNVLQILQLAVSNLSTVETTFESTSMFWTNMEEKCNLMNPETLSQDIDDINSLGDEDEIFNIYNEEDFKKEVSNIANQWLAFSCATNTCLLDYYFIRSNVVQLICK